MAKDKDKKKDKKDKKEKKGKSGKPKGNKMSLKSRLFMIVFVLLSLAFLPTSMLLGVAMLPTIVAVFISVRRRGARASTVAAMNLAGCMPFVLKLWSGSNDFAASFLIITDPNSMVVIYTAACFGYLIDWVVTGIVSSFLYQKGMVRMKAIKKRQEFLVSHWGEEIAGTSKNVEE